MILITGGAGNMGRKLALALAARGDEVRVLCLPGDPAAAGMVSEAAAHAVAGKIHIAYADITQAHSLPAAVAGADTVFHLAAVLLSPGKPEAFRTVNAEGTRNLVAAAEAAGTRHFIYVSSISVEYPRSNAYARSKLQGEQCVKGSPMAHTIIRPTLAYAEGGGSEFMGLIDHLRRGRIVFLPAGGRARKSPVHIDDVVAGLSALPGNAKAFGKTYAFSGGEALSLRAMARALLAHMGRPKPIFGVPAWMCLLGAGAFWLRAKVTGGESPFTYQTYTGLVQDAAPSHLAAQADLGYNPRPFREGVAGLASLRNALHGSRLVP